MLGCLFWFVALASPHWAVLWMSLKVGGGECAQPLQMWFLLVGYIGLAWYIVRVCRLTCLQDDNDGRLYSRRGCCTLLIYLLGSAWVMCITLLIFANRSCLAFDVAEFNRLHVNRTLFGGRDYNRSNSLH